MFDNIKINNTNELEFAVFCIENIASRLERNAEEYIKERGVLTMMSQMSVMEMMKAMVPITRFNKGEASRIFDEVEASGTKIVMKNNKPACILMSPEQYESLMEMLSDYILLDEAKKRTQNMD